LSHKYVDVECVHYCATTVLTTTIESAIRAFDISDVDRCWTFVSSTVNSSTYHDMMKKSHVKFVNASFDGLEYLYTNGLQAIALYMLQL
jgi:hypothetical protein